MIQIVTTANANLRSAPTTNGSPLTTLNKGSSIQATKLENGWYEIKAYLSPIVVHEITALVEGEIPYFSQWDLDANARTSDCGQTCVKMVAATKGIDVRVNDLPYQSQPNGISSPADLVMNFKKVGLISDVIYTRDLQLGDICLVNYGAFSRDNVQDKKFTGMHWVVFISQDENNVVINDPDWSGLQREGGHNKSFSAGEWDLAFASDTLVRLTNGVK